MTTLMTPTTAAYDAIFAAERAVVYPAVDAFEIEAGFALDRAKLEGAARVLACPLKAHAPNWQHGRVLYAAARRALRGQEQHATLVDIGTAKGFSALCLLWAARDSGVDAEVWSCDVLDPAARVRRNTVAEVGGLKTLFETVAPWPESGAIQFVRATGIELLQRIAQLNQRVSVAFVDGKHSEAAVTAEATVLARLQRPGDLVLFDDAQIEGVRAAIERARADYDVAMLDVLPGRRYAIGRRRG